VDLLDMTPVCPEFMEEAEDVLCMVVLSLVEMLVLNVLFG
jgi:hypothetical protein